MGSIRTKLWQRLLPSATTREACQLLQENQSIWFSLLWISLIRWFNPFSLRFALILWSWCGLPYIWPVQHLVHTFKLRYRPFSETVALRNIVESTDHNPRSISDLQGLRWLRTLSYNVPEYPFLSKNMGVRMRMYRSIEHKRIPYLLLNIYWSNYLFSNWGTLHDGIIGQSFNFTV